MIRKEREMNIPMLQLVSLRTYLCYVLNRTINFIDYFLFFNMTSIPVFCVNIQSYAEISFILETIALK
jgi:hypothetical protein